MGIGWISAIGRFHRTRGDGWPRTGGQVKHEGSRRCSNSRTKGTRPIQQQADSQDWPPALRRRSTSIHLPPCFRSNASPRFCQPSTRSEHASLRSCAGHFATRDRRNRYRSGNLSLAADIASKRSSITRTVGGECVGECVGRMIRVPNVGSRSLSRPGSRAGLVPGGIGYTAWAVVVEPAV